jgi:A/G-specific adenine glycosylase
VALATAIVESSDVQVPWHRTPAAILRLVPTRTADPPAVVVSGLVAFPPAARAPILAWYVDHGRSLAFRRTTDPYAILVAETMAQQTQAARAAAHWERWMERFPSVAALAAAAPADVLRAWQGLGYDRRALALWRAARTIVTEHGGHVPSALAELEALPGVGPYTARAVAALAFGMRVGAVDVNVRRVLGRMVAGSPDRLAPRQLQAIADDAVPPGRAAEWTHAVMDIGATLCRPRSPRCAACPARRWCRYAATHGASMEGVPPRVTRPPASLPFPETTRWLRGRILDRARAATNGQWVRLDGAIGVHAHERVHDAARSMAADGLLELRTRDGDISVRLPGA